MPFHAQVSLKLGVLMVDNAVPRVGYVELSCSYRRKRPYMLKFQCVKIYLCSYIRVLTTDLKCYTIFTPFHNIYTLKTSLT